MTAKGNKRCIALLGGSFDPVHNGHVALGSYIARLLAPDELRVIPAGRPWQKQSLRTPSEHRVAMAKLAFAHFAIPVHVDEQEIRRDSPTYTIDTLRAIRAEAGPNASLALVIGADQLHGLNTWKEWRALFDYAHVCAVSRPGFDPRQLPPDVAHELSRRTATPEQIRQTPHGLASLTNGLSVDISATQIRHALEHGDDVGSLIPSGVLDYIKQHHLYRT